MSKESFRIVYDGEAVEAGAMDVRDLAPALLALGNLCQDANRILNGEKARISVQVRADIKKGSFEVNLDLVVSFYEMARALILEGEIQDGAQILKTLGIYAGTGIGLFRLYKWLHGRKPKQIEPGENGTVIIQVEDDSIEVPGSVHKLYEDSKTKRDLESFVRPLKREDIDRVAFRKGEEIQAEITREEEPYFASFSLEDQEEVFEGISEGVYEIVQPSFTPDLKWRLSDGQRRFTATMVDEEFFRNVEQHEEGFFKGDLIRCEILTRSWMTERGLTSEKLITKVLDLRHEPKQQDWIGLKK